MNYNLVADCISKNIPKLYLPMIRELSAKYSFRPGCIKIMEGGNFDIIGDSIVIAFRVSQENASRYISVKSTPQDNSGIFEVVLSYHDSCTQLPLIEGFKRVNQGQYEFKSEKVLDPMMPRVIVSYYDNNAISVHDKQIGTWKENFIDPDALFIFAGDPGMSDEEFIARLLTGRYDKRLEAETQWNKRPAKSKVY